MKEYTQSKSIDRPADEVFGWLKNVNNVPKYLPPIKSADVLGPAERQPGERLWLRGEIPDRGEFENEGYLHVDDSARTMEWGAEASRDYSGQLETRELSGGRSEVTVRLWFGERSVEGDIQEESREDRNPLEEGLGAALESISNQLEEGAGKEPQPSPEG